MKSNKALRIVAGIISILYGLHCFAGYVVNDILEACFESINTFMSFNTSLMFILMGIGMLVGKRIIVGIGAAAVAAAAVAGMLSMFDIISGLRYINDETIIYLLLNYLLYIAAFTFLALNSFLPKPVKALRLLTVIFIICADFVLPRMYILIVYDFDFENYFEFMVLYYRSFQILVELLQMASVILLALGLREEPKARDAMRMEYYR